MISHSLGSNKTSISTPLTPHPAPTPPFLTVLRWYFCSDSWRLFFSLIFYDMLAILFVLIVQNDTFVVLLCGLLLSWLNYSNVKTESERGLDPIKSSLSVSPQPPPPPPRPTIIFQWSFRGGTSVVVPRFYKLLSLHVYGFWQCDRLTRCLFCFLFCFVFYFKKENR